MTGFFYPLVGPGMFLLDFLQEKEKIDHVFTFATSGEVLLKLYQGLYLIQYTPLGLDDHSL